MGPPAARMTDMHVCPMVTGVVPHVGGPILPPCMPDCPYWGNCPLRDWGIWLHASARRTSSPWAP